MKTKINEFMNAKAAAERILNKINKVGDEIMDDGRDNEDYQQNVNFSASLSVLEDAQHEASLIEIPGVDMNALWNEHCKNINLSYPENKCNFLIDYCNAIIELCNNA